MFIPDISSKYFLQIFTLNITNTHQEGMEPPDPQACPPARAPQESPGPTSPPPTAGVGDPDLAVGAGARPAGTPHDRWPPTGVAPDNSALGKAGVTRQPHTDGPQPTGGCPLQKYPPKKRCPGRRVDPLRGAAPPLFQGVPPMGGGRDRRGYPAAALARALLPWLGPVCPRPRPALHLVDGPWGRPCAASGGPWTRKKDAALAAKRLSNCPQNRRLRWARWGAGPKGGGAGPWAGVR
jgi:hypothetical protein